MSENFTAGSGSVYVGIASPPRHQWTHAVFHKAIARKYEDMADHTTKRSERRECLNAALHHYLEAYADDSPDAK